MQFWEFRKHLSNDKYKYFSHFISSFSTSDINNYFGIRIFTQSLRNTSFSTSESLYIKYIFTPGIAQVPPKTDGKRESKTLCPVNNGVLPANFS
jgi:hypothetical protein